MKLYSDKYKFIWGPSYKGVKGTPLRDKKNIKIKKRKKTTRVELNCLQE